MPDANESQVLAATRRWLKPVVHVLLRCGITWQQFCDLAKVSYVEVATAKFGKRGRPTNVSRTAMLTGLTRRDVRIQRERLERADPTTSMYTSKASQILSLWHLDKEFRDKGRPALLDFEGDRRSFSALAQRVGASDVPTQTILKELVSAGAARVRPDGRVEALQRNYIPRVMDAQLVRLWGTVLGDVAQTYAHNMTRDPKVPPKFERAAKNERVRVSASPAFRAFLEREGQAFLERVDAWLAENEAPDGQGTPDVPATRMGAGVYQIEDPQE
jgi:hypothetical protein